ncbi:MAG: diaminopimelate epimerase [Polaribacter sp.]|nr:diaminopimelate epimerase [Polaribacter sp.]
MNLEFYKYQGTGNDFVMIDNRSKSFPKENTNIIPKLCDRHFGIGADGVILIENDTNFDFKMIYFNADGSQTFCGNGGRCAVAFAKDLKIINSNTNFSAFDGAHFAKIEKDIISLKMKDVDEILVHENSIFINTGTQHHVELVDDLDNFPVFKKGKEIRYSYDGLGSNVNFVQQISPSTFRVRTYEKGVEDETLACGTGVTAVAIAMHKTKKTDHNLISLPVEGGNLEVSFTEKNGVYKNVFLKGSALLVFKGNTSI